MHLQMILAFLPSVEEVSHGQRVPLREGPLWPLCLQQEPPQWGSIPMVPAALPQTPVPFLEGEAACEGPFTDDPVSLDDVQKWSPISHSHVTHK